MVSIKSTAVEFNEDGSTFNIVSLELSSDLQPISRNEDRI
jgi:hypothetical protein